MAVTIKQIADATGVSRGTVDRVLHNRPGVKADIVAIVRNAADEMGYVPNRAGKMLAGKKQPMTIGCFLPSVGNPFFDDVVKGLRIAESELSDFGVSLEIIEIAGYEPQEHIAAIRRLAENGCAALCVSTIDVPEIRACVDEIVERGIPVVTMNTDISNTKRLCYVGCDYIKCGRTAAGLLEKMARPPLRILIVTGSLKMKGHNERMEGFLQTLDAKHTPYEVVSIVESLDNETLAYSKVCAQLSQHERINCVYIVAAGVKGACQAIVEMGLSGRLYVLSHDDVPSTRQYLQDDVIGFTICQEPEQQGIRAVNALFNYFVTNRQEVPENWLANTVIKIKENV